MNRDYEYGFDFEAAKRQLGEFDTGEMDDLPLVRRIEMLRDIAIALDTPDRLEEFRRVWRKGIVPEHIGFFLVARNLLGIADSEEDSRALRALDERIEAIQRQHGIPASEGWPLGEGPAEYRRLQREYTKLRNERCARVMRQFGEPELAAMFLDNRDEFLRRVEAGRLALFGPIPPTD